MTTYYQRVQLQVVAGGQDITNYVTAVRTNYSFGLRVPEAEVTVYDLPAGINTWSTLTIDAGLTGTGTAGSSRRFTGLVYDPSHDVWPQSKVLAGRGHLILAERCVAPNDEDVEEGGLPVTPEFLAEGIDMSLSPAGADWRDSDMIWYALNRAGLGGYLGTLGGLSQYLGAYAPEQFIWRRGQSALAFCEDLDKIALGHRTFESPDGIIRRFQASPSVPFNNTLVEVNEATHILPGANLIRTAREAKNRFVVTGFDDGYGAGPVRAIGSCAHVSPPYAGAIETDSFSSPLIELDEPVGIYGLSCREVALWRMAEYGQAYVEARVPTWYDFAFQPGGIVYLNSPRLANIMQTLWIVGIECEVTRDSFRQTLTLRGAWAANEGWSHGPLPVLFG